MKVHKDWIESKKSATQGDLADLQEDIHVDLETLGTDLRGEIASSRRVNESMLKVLQSIEGRLKDMAHHEVRIRRLEKHVFGSAMR